MTVSGLNHVAHRSTVKDSFDTPWDLDGDGKLSLREANEWYRNGNGEAITVDASKIDLKFVKTSDLSKDEYTSVQTLMKSKDGRVYGHLSLKLVDNSNKVTIARDRYDFEMHGSKITFRNAATVLGNIVAGSGTPYYINFSGYGLVGRGISSYIIPFVNFKNYIDNKSRFNNVIFKF